jgi:hypothetical protein
VDKEVEPNAKWGTKGEKHPKFLIRRKGERDEPTEAQLERHIKQLQHGKADGEIIIRNESPRMTGGVHTVVGNVRKDRSSFKGTAEGEESC